MKMKLFLSALVLCNTFAHGQKTKEAQPVARLAFHNCSSIGSSGNAPHLFDVSEVYRCDEGDVEIVGHREMAIENGYVFTQELGRPTGEPYRATAMDYQRYKWCDDPKPWDLNQKKMCGDVPNKCYDGKMGAWDPNWQGYSCVRPDHK